MIASANCYLDFTEDGAAMLGFLQCWLNMRVIQHVFTAHQLLQLRLLNRNDLFESLSDRLYMIQLYT